MTGELLGRYGDGAPPLSPCRVGWWAEWYRVWLPVRWTSPPAGRAQPQPPQQPLASSQGPSCHRPGRSHPSSARPGRREGLLLLRDRGPWWSVPGSASPGTRRAPSGPRRSSRCGPSSSQVSGWGAICPTCPGQRPAYPLAGAHQGLGCTLWAGSASLSQGLRTGPTGCVGVSRCVGVSHRDSCSWGSSCPGRQEPLPFLRGSAFTMRPLGPRVGPGASAGSRGLPGLLLGRTPPPSSFCPGVLSPGASPLFC